MCLIMKRKRSQVILLSLVLSEIATAGESVKPSTYLTPAIEKSAAEYFKFSLDARLRYESRNEQSFDPSNALTLRARPGITLLPGRTLSGFFESEHTVVIGSDFRASNNALRPFRVNNTQIPDPESNEVNQAFLQFEHEGLKARVGRQRIKLDNLLFVGNAGWRQNEQTFEAATLDYNKNGVSLYYGYASQINRVFGSEAFGTQKKFEGDMHLINASTKIGEVKLGGYSYLLDFNTAAEFASSNSYGIQLDYKGFHAEYAYQTEAGDRASYGANYAHFFYAKDIGNVTYKGGVEYLEDEFVSPIAALHGGNGFSDVFIPARRGIPGNDWDGITDIYAVAKTDIGNTNLKAAAHYFWNDSFSSSYGWELDLVLTKKLSKNLTLVAVGAFFFGDNGTDNDLFNNDVVQNSIQLDYRF